MKVRQILTTEFTAVPDLHALFLEASNRGHVNLYAQVDAGVDPDAVGDEAFEAFKAVADRIVMETGGDPVLIWYGLVQRRIPGALEVKL